MGRRWWEVSGGQPVQGRKRERGLNRRVTGAKAGCEEQHHSGGISRPDTAQKGDRGTATYLLSPEGTGIEGAKKAKTWADESLTSSTSFDSSAAVKGLARRANSLNVPGAPVYYFLPQRGRRDPFATVVTEPPVAGRNGIASMTTAG